MSGTALVVDPISTIGIILKVKLTAGFYQVPQTEIGSDAMSLMETLRPDIILINNVLVDFSTTLRGRLKSC